VKPLGVRITSCGRRQSLPADAIANEFAQDVSAEEANLIAATQGPVRAANFEQKVTVAAWTTKPAWYIVAAQDRMIHPEAQRALAKKIKARTTILPTSHVPMASNPEAVAEVIAEAALARGKGSRATLDARRREVALTS
jgi:pimeloyl-ACP methyl ester carboxylesterase